MTETEYITLGKRLKKLFPAIMQWFATLDETNVEGIRERWRKCLKDVPYDAAAAAVERLATASTDPWPFPGDKERAAAIVAETARKMFPARFDQSEQDQLGMRKPHRRDSYKGTGTFAKICRAIEEHPDHSDECRAFRMTHDRCLKDCPVPELVAREMAHEPCNLPPDNRRFDCAECRDTGYVSCLKHGQVSEACKTRRKPLVMLTYSARCTCRHGRDKLNQEHWREFDSGLDVPVSHDEKRLVASCVAFVEAYENRNRTSEFDQFNERGVSE